MSAKKIADRQRLVRGQVESKFDPNEEAWSLICDSAGLDIDRGVPVEGQRHLVTSWAGIGAGISVFIKMLKKEHAKEMADLKRQHKAELNRADNVAELTGKKADAEKVSMSARAVAHIQDEELRALVAEEFAA